MLTVKCFFLEVSMLLKIFSWTSKSSEFVSKRFGGFDTFSFAESVGVAFCDRFLFFIIVV